MVEFCSVFSALMNSHPFTTPSWFEISAVGHESRIKIRRPPLRHNTHDDVYSTGAASAVKIMLATGLSLALERSSWPNAIRQLSHLQAGMDF